MKKKIFIAMLIATMSFSIVACGSITKEDTNATTESSKVDETKKSKESSTKSKTTEESTESEATTSEDTAETATIEDANAATEGGYTFIDKSGTLYATQSVNVRDLPDTNGNKLTTVKAGTELILLGQCNETGWYKVEYANDKVGYVSNAYVSTEKPAVQQQSSSNATSQQPSNNEAAQPSGGNTNTQPASSGGIPDSEVESFCAANGWDLNSCPQIDENTYVQIEAETAYGHFRGAWPMITDGRTWHQDETIILYENPNAKEGELIYVTKHIWRPVN